MPHGICTCGAVYACDVTGNNLGTAMVEALLFASQGDWDRAWDLLPGDDYADAQVRDYDLQTHLVVQGGNMEGRRISGVLFFIRLHAAGREPIAPSPAPPSGSDAAGVPETPSRRRGRKAFGKRHVEAQVHNYRIPELVELAAGDKRIIRDLQRLLYAVDLQLRYRAADALGQVAARVSRDHPDTVIRLLQGLFTALTDTAASSWGYIDAIGEIIRNRPRQYGRYVARLTALSRDRTLLPEVLRALGRIARTQPDLIRPARSSILALLTDSDPEARGYAALLIDSLGAEGAEKELMALTEDPVMVRIYVEGNLVERSVGEIASDALRNAGLPRP